MPAGLAFLNVKSWHPATYQNQKRIWIAEQKAKEQEKREKEAAKQLAKEMETIKYEEMARTRGASMSMLATDQEKHQQGKTAMAFLYAKPPGLMKAAKGSGSVEAGDGAGAEDEAVKEFYRKAAAKKKKDPDFSMHSQITTLERMTGKKPRTDDLTVEEQVERFPFLKDAPVEGEYASNVRLQFKPFNKLVRNTRCLRCGEWGHQTGDRECTLKDFNPHDAARQQREDPLTYMRQAMAPERDKIVLKRTALPREMAVMQQHGGKAAGLHEVVLEDDDHGALGGAGMGFGGRGGGGSGALGGAGGLESVDDAYLAKLSTKEKKALLKQLKREQQAVLGGGDGGGGEGEDEDRDRKRKRKKKKEKKHKKEKKRKSSSSSRHKHKRRKRSSSSSDSSSSSSGSDSD